VRPLGLNVVELPGCTKNKSCGPLMPGMNANRAGSRKYKEIIIQIMKYSLIRKWQGILGAGLLAVTVPVTADEGTGMIYTMDNAAAANQVLAWKRAAHGTLTGPVLTATGGAGSGAGLSSEGSVLLTRDARWLFVCNAGSDEISRPKGTPTS
jgi:hypothetical protein